MRALTVALLCLTMLFTFAGGLLAEGTVQSDLIWISSLTSLKQVTTYLPEGYDPSDTETLYPTVFFLHGGYTTPASYPMLIDVLDDIIWTGDGEPPEGYIHPVICVMPDGNFGDYGGMTWWNNSEVNGAYSDYVWNDLVTWADDTYNTCADPSKRAIMGHSMGGYGALSNALRHTDVFRAVGTHGGVIDFTTTINGITPWVLDENGGSGPYSPAAGVWSEVLFSMAAAFSPNLDNQPDPVDLPIDNNGDIDPDIWPEWVNDDPPHLALDHTAATQPAMYIQVGEDDELWDEVAAAFVDSVLAQGLECRFDIHPGDHNNALADRFPYTLAFFDSVFYNITSAPEHGLQRTLPDQFELHPAHPNPFNATTRCVLDLPQPAHVELALYDTLGRQVRRVHDGFLAPGRHTFAVSGRNIAGGLYFLHAEVDGVSGLTQKLVLLK
ncbi:prolyl oligopeptidase family serine peptidase [bacterium]|nr:prolyl oligopeptidase family serine peptidase [bacterium]